MPPGGKRSDNFLRNLIHTRKTPELEARNEEPAAEQETITHPIHPRRFGNVREVAKKKRFVRCYHSGLVYILRTHTPARRHAHHHTSTGRKSSRWCWMKKKLRLSYNPLPPPPLTTPKPPPPVTLHKTGLGRAEIENKNFSHFYIFLHPCVRFPTFPLSHVINFICSVRRRRRRLLAITSLEIRRGGPPPNTHSFGHKYNYTMCGGYVRV